MRRHFLTLACLGGLLAAASDALADDATKPDLDGATIRSVVLDKAKIDDPVGAISVHGVVGIWGLLAVFCLRYAYARFRRRLEAKSPPACLAAETTSTEGAG